MKNVPKKILIINRLRVSRKRIFFKKQLWYFVYLNPQLYCPVIHHIPQLGPRTFDEGRRFEVEKPEH